MLFHFTINIPLKHKFQTSQILQKKELTPLGMRIEVPFQLPLQAKIKHLLMSILCYIYLFISICFCISIIFHRNQLNISSTMFLCCVSITKFFISAPKIYLHSSVSCAPASLQSKLLFPMPMPQKISYMS